MPMIVLLLRKIIYISQNTTLKCDIALFPGYLDYRLRLQLCFPSMRSWMGSEGHIKTAEQRTIIQQYGDWYIGRWWVSCYLIQRGGGWAGCVPAQASPHCTKCNSSPINGQCTNFILLDVALKLPLNSKGFKEKCRFAMRERKYNHANISYTYEVAFLTCSGSLSCHIVSLSL